MYVCMYVCTYSASKFSCFIVCINRYSGTLATLSRDVPFSLLFFPGYANLKVFEIGFISTFVCTVCMYICMYCMYVCMYGHTYCKKNIFMYECMN